MEPVTLSTIAKWAGGELLRDDPARTVSHIRTDSRALKAGDLFLALRGGKFDAHDFVPQAPKLGAAGVIVENVPAGLPENFPVIRVADTLAALQRVAAHYRQTLSLQVVALTGSNGKTSTKDFTAAVLAEKFRVTKTQGNFNNHIGLPLTILRATAQDEIGVWEIGMNHPGEIAPLAKLAAPDVAVITNIGTAHIEFMGTREAIALEKGMLAEAIGAGGHVVLPAADDFAESIAARTKARVIRAGVGAGEIRAADFSSDENGSHFTVQNAHGDSAAAHLPVPGEHMIRNALLAISVGQIFGISLAECAAGLAKMQLTGGRMETKNIRAIRFLDDSYNANPDSMIAALRTLATMPGRHIAVLGQMSELGTESERGHHTVGEAAAREKVPFLITVGPIAAGIAEAARANGNAEIFTTANHAEAAALLREIVCEGDTVLVKGSRSARMETVLAEFSALGPRLSTRPPAPSAA